MGKLHDEKFYLKCAWKVTPTGGCQIRPKSDNGLKYTATTVVIVCAILLARAVLASWGVTL